MSLELDLYHAHQERIARIYGAGINRPKPEPAPPKRIEIRETQEPQKIPVNSIIWLTPDEWPAYEALADWSNPQKLKRIRREVARQHNLTEEDISGPSRKPELCAARYEYCYRAVVETTASLPVIGRFIKRDHTTIISAVGSYCVKHNLPFPRGASWKCFKNRAERRQKMSADRKIAK